MAGVKITDLGTLTAPDAADLLYIVDVSDTSQSPQGTSKQIELGNIGIGGAWTPSVSSYSGAINNANFDAAIYSVSGKVVTCSMQGAAGVDFSSTTEGILNFSLPIVAASDILGCVTIRFANQCNGIVQQSGRIILSSNDTSFIDGAVSFFATFQYLIA